MAIESCVSYNFFLCLLIILTFKIAAYPMRVHLMLQGLHRLEKCLNKQDVMKSP